jgi:hypothetical protein
MIKTAQEQQQLAAEKEREKWDTRDKKVMDRYVY